MRCAIQMSGCPRGERRSQPVVCSSITPGLTPCKIVIWSLLALSLPKYVWWYAAERSRTREADDSSYCGLPWAVNELGLVAHLHDLEDYLVESVIVHHLATRIEIVYAAGQISCPP